MRLLGTFQWTSGILICIMPISSVNGIIFASFHSLFKVCVPRKGRFLNCIETQLAQLLEWVEVRGPDIDEYTFFCLSSSMSLNREYVWNDNFHVRRSAWYLKIQIQHFFLCFFFVNTTTKLHSISNQTISPPTYAKNQLDNCKWFIYELRYQRFILRKM